MSNERRAEEFLECLGNGKTIYQIESEEELSEELNKENLRCHSLI